jgi:uncharacterized membrane protein
MTEIARTLRKLHLGACVSLVALIFLCLAWELWLAPIRPGGSWLALKALPLLAPLMGVLHGRRYTFQWSSMLILAYFAEGVVRASGDSGPAAHLAQVEILLTLTYFGSAVFYAKLGRREAR